MLNIVPKTLFLYKSQGILPLHNPLTKEATQRGVSICIISNELHTTSQKNMFIVEMERVYPLNWLNNRFDWLADSINLTSQASSGPTFRQRLLSMDCVDVRYHYTLTCKADFTWMLNVKFTRDEPLLLSFFSLKLSLGTLGV